MITYVAVMFVITPVHAIDIFSPSLLPLLQILTKKSFLILMITTAPRERNLRPFTLHWGGGAGLKGRNFGTVPQQGSAGTAHRELVLLTKQDRGPAMKLMQAPLTGTRRPICTLLGRLWRPRPRTS